MKRRLIGRILGVIFGFAVFGPIGALIGFFIGLYIDNKLAYQAYLRSTTKYEYSSHSSRNLEREEIFLKATFVMMGYMAKAKGRVSREDIKFAEELICNFQLDDTRTRLAQDAFTQGKDGNFDIKILFKKLSEVCQGNKSLLDFFLLTQLKIALTDGYIATEERSLLYLIGKFLNFKKVYIDACIQEAEASYRFSQNYSYNSRNNEEQTTDSFTTSVDETLKNSYSILGVKPTDNKTIIKRAYKAQMIKFHPDKLVAKGAPPEMLNIAKERAQQAQGAYELICKARGWKN